MIWKNPESVFLNKKSIFSRLWQFGKTPKVIRSHDRTALVRP